MFLSFLLLFQSLFAYFDGQTTLDLLKPITAKTVNAVDRVHPMHLAVTEMNYNPTTQTFEISHKIFFDDLEKTISEATKQKLLLNTPQENPKTDSYIQKYLQINFQVFCNQKPQSITFVGKEYENDAVWVYCEIANVPASLQYLEIKNTILLATFDDQINFLHFKKGTFSKSWRFTIDNTVQQWEF